ncbi:ribonuclease-3 [Arthrobacter stackebrandtii]|uniref:Ribonuclease 3 n=1 Tax=Arthrobacter stackebrandtii TaxID=272161 RepID=A0ABS4YZ83_9MICC|nr:ribonuclease III [Arthrobacter stackebrandtii]MBP2414098.1 ribonuclease-3 [Arthrobacter stackebrandtii]PYG99359.1 ribonuclease III [Arthrobacter stackebrandtii]
MSADLPSPELTDGHKLLMKRLGVSIDAGTLRLALTHRSYAYENGGIPTNERLEFLGDSILGFSVTDALYRDNPTLPEGDLAKRRSSVVSTRALASIARDLGVGEFIYLGHGERITKGRNKSSILADTMEALIGATYLTHGIETARELVMRLVGPLLADADVLGAGTDWKTNIQEISAARHLGTIVYDITGTGPDHARSFSAALVIGGRHYGTGTGPSKKEAERSAAAAGWIELQKKYGPGEDASAATAAKHDGAPSSAAGSPAVSSAASGANAARSGAKQAK